MAPKLVCVCVRVCVLLLRVVVVVGALPRVYHQTSILLLATDQTRSLRIQRLRILRAAQLLKPFKMFDSLFHDTVQR